VHGHIKTATLMSPQAGIKVTGDILVLQPSVTSPIPNNDSLWLWTGSFLKAVSMVPGTEVKTTQILSITLGGHLLAVVNPSTTTASTHLTPEDRAEVNANDTTWALTTEAIETAITLLWGRIATQKIALSSLPSIGATCDSFPYQTSDGTSVLPIDSNVSY